ncbi:MAG: helix-turn-helix transcriptional regulator [Terriglobia bacterium]
MKNRLRVLRAEREWSQAELARRLKVSRQTANAIETGKYDPSLPLAFNIAKLFKQPIEAIFEPDATESGYELLPEMKKWRTCPSDS